MLSTTLKRFVVGVLDIFSAMFRQMAWEVRNGGRSLPTQKFGAADGALICG